MGKRGQRPHRRDVRAALEQYCIVGRLFVGSGPNHAHLQAELSAALQRLSRRVVEGYVSDGSCVDTRVKNLGMVCTRRLLHPILFLLL
jgi:hypothetical protein